MKHHTLERMTFVAGFLLTATVFVVSFAVARNGASTQTPALHGMGCAGMLAAFVLLLPAASLARLARRAATLCYIAAALVLAWLAVVSAHAGWWLAALAAIVLGLHRWQRLFVAGKS